MDILLSRRHGCDVLKKLIFPIVWKNSKFTHRETDESKATKESTDGRALQIDKGFTGAFELYSTENGKNEFYN